MSEREKEKYLSRSSQSPTATGGCVVLVLRIKEDGCDRRREEGDEATGGASHARAARVPR